MKQEILIDLTMKSENLTSLDAYLKWENVQNNGLNFFLKHRGFDYI